MVLGLVLTQDGRPVCSEMWPGNVADVTALEAVAGRLQHPIRSVCLVADRGMISKATMAAGARLAIHPGRPRQQGGSRGGAMAAR